MWTGHPIREDLPFYQYAEEWYTLKKEPFISDASRSAYHTMFNKHLLPAFGLRHLRAISAGEYTLSSIPSPIPANRRSRWR